MLALQKSDDRVPIQGRVQVDVYDAETGERLRRIEKNNLVTTAGKALMANLLRGTGGAVSHIATGSDGSAPTVTDTTLGSEAYRDQVTSYSTGGGGEVTFRLFIGAASANGTVIREAGLFDAVSGGTLVARVAFAPAEQITKSDDITAQISWTIDIG